VISGSYSPGSIYVFKGLGKGEYAKSEKLRFTTGMPVQVGNASAVAVTDWNRDGRLDLVVGDIDGDVWFVPNESRDKKRPFAGLIHRARRLYSPRSLSNSSPAKR